MLIDFHTHAFPDAIAGRAVERLSYVSGGLKPHTDGTLSGLRARMAADGVGLSVVLSIATNAGQQQKVNDFAAAVNAGKNTVAFGSVYPHSPDAIEELSRIKALGLKGVKLHPNYQNFLADDEKLKPLYREISRLGLITVFHAGWDYGFPPPYGGTPERLLRALSWLDTPVIAAHWGGVSCCEGVLEHLCGREVWFDTSFGYSMLPKYFAQKILEKHGTEKILFGTDTPWHTAGMEMRLLGSLGLSQQEMDAITHKNACRLLGI